jgi:hypothetical protein
LIKRSKAKNKEILKTDSSSKSSDLRGFFVQKKSKIVQKFATKPLKQPYKGVYFKPMRFEKTPFF